jgi:parallel beta-helix repeat protein
VTYYNNLQNNYVTNNGDGIYLSGADQNNISNNIITSNNMYGIRFFGSDENEVTKNHVSNNGFGAYIRISGNNKIYHNNFIDNTNQSFDDRSNNYWDNDYPSGGNYWSDYMGVDNYKGPDQDIPGSDGIGDTNYSIDSDSTDNYPLMEPIENYTILKQGWNLISTPLVQEDQNLIKVLEMIHGYYEAVQWYDVRDSEDHWEHFQVGKSYGNDLAKLNETKGFWIYMTPQNGAVLLHNGTQPTSNQTIQLYEGWNMVGYPSLTSYNRTEGLNNLTYGQKVDLIQWYDAETKTWHDLGENDYFVPGRGYWVHAKAECEWEVPL